jgi:hypothetical protein
MGGTYTAGAWEQGAGENIRTEEGLIGGWRKLHNELHNLYSSSSKITMIKSSRIGWEWHVARMETRNSYMILVGKPDGKRPTTRKTKTCVGG